MPIPATRTPFAHMPHTDTAGSGLLRQTPHRHSSAYRIHAPSSALEAHIADNCAGALDRHHPLVPCTAGLNRGAGVASASDLPGKFLFLTGLAEGSVQASKPSGRSSPRTYPAFSLLL